MTPSSRTAPWSNVYGLARTLIASSVLLTLLLNGTNVLWTPAVGIPAGPLCTRSQTVPNLFCVAPDHLELTRWIAIVVLAIVASGWRPRLTGIAHWWVTHSLVSSALLMDGGDQLASTLTFIMLPLTLTDGRRWHWQAAPRWPETVRGNLAAGLGAATLWALRVQVAVVYLNAAAAKWGETQWADGTAVYYWFSDPAFGFTPTLRAMFGPLMLTGAGVSIATWSVIVLEFSLFAGLFTTQRVPRRVMLILGIGFHVAIAFVHGLPSFVLIMFGALVLLLRREHEPLALPRVLSRSAFGQLLRRQSAPRRLCVSEPGR